MTKKYLVRWVKYHIWSRLIYFKNELTIFFNQEIILVYTMGKVGSTSIYNAIRRSPFTPVFHIHSLDITETKKLHHKLKLLNLFPDSRKNIKSILKAIRRQKKIKIISLVRDPYQRNLSAFFDTLDYHGLNIDEYDYNNYKNQFESKFDFLYPLNWFNDELERYTNIDIYKPEYKLIEGSSHIIRDQIEILILQSNISNSIKRIKLNNFLNREIKKITVDNSSKNKKYHKHYMNFKYRYHYPKEIVNKIENTRFYNFFFI